MIGAILEGTEAGWAAILAMLAVLAPTLLDNV